MKHVFLRKFHQDQVLAPRVFRRCIHWLKRPVGFWGSQWRWRQLHWKPTGRKFRLVGWMSSEVQMQFSDLLISELVFLFLKLANHQLLSKKMADMDLSSLSSSSDFQASDMKDLLQTLPQVSCCQLPVMHLNRQPSLFQFFRKKNQLYYYSNNFSNGNCYSHIFTWFASDAFPFVHWAALLCFNVTHQCNVLSSLV